MPTITTTDGTEIFYQDWGVGQSVVSSHGWPLCADAWDGQLFARNAELEVYPGGPHGLTGAHEQEFDADLLAFARG
jgi:pimeloyl-ACP methyl ester carboxylesterase